MRDITDILGRIEDRKFWDNQQPDPNHPCINILQEQLKKDFEGQAEVSFEGVYIRFKKGSKTFKVKADLPKLSHLIEGESVVYSRGGGFEFFYGHFKDAIQAELDNI